MRILVVLFTLLLFSNAHADSLPKAPHIAVNGKYEVKTTPDTLKLSLEIIEISRDVKVARNVVESRSKKLINSAQSIGLKREDITSAALSLTPRYNWQNSQQIYTGTEISRKIELNLRDMSKYDDLIKAILDANVARINNSQLSSSKEKELKAQAMQQAVSDATMRAKMLVTDLPQKVGSVYSINAYADQPMPTRDKLMYRMADAAMMPEADSAFEPGTMSFSQSVQVVFYLIEE